MMWEWHASAASWFLAMSLVMGGLGALVAWAVLTARQGDTTPPESIVAQRYIRGEIDAEQYRPFLNDIAPAQARRVAS